MVAKEDSISTPIRLVVDPTMSGLNLILRKGENRIGSINQILIGNRADPYSWSSDITKLYNIVRKNMKESDIRVINANFLQLHRAIEKDIVRINMKE